MCQEMGLGTHGSRKEMSEYPLLFYSTLAKIYEYIPPCSRCMKVLLSTLQDWQPCLSFGITELLECIKSFEFRIPLLNHRVIFVPRVVDEEGFLRGVVKEESLLGGKSDGKTNFLTDSLRAIRSRKGRNVCRT